MAGQSDWSDLAFVGFFFISLALLTLWSFLRVAAPLLRFLGTSSIAFVTDNNAKLYYGNKWLALWHPLDEPINGLSGTLGNAPEIAPRVRADGWLNLIPFFGPFANRILANAADEFAWAQVTDRLQGADYLQYRLASVGRAPHALRPGFESIHQSIATDMERGADQKAAGTVARIRALLETAYDNQNSQAVFDRLRGVISFQEVIHTSYFAHPEIPSILACHVLRSLSPLVNFDKVPEAVKDARVPPAIKRDLAAPHPRPARRRNLEFVTTMAFWLAPATLLALGASGAYESKIAPETSKYTVRKILESLKDLSRVSVGDSDSVGQVIVRLTRLGAIDDPINELEKVPDTRAHPGGAVAVARYLGEKGDFAGVERLLIGGRLAQGDNPDELGKQIRRAAVLGAAQGHVGRIRLSMREAGGILDGFENDLRTNWPTNDLGVADNEAQHLGEALGALGEYRRIERLFQDESEHAKSSRLARCAFVRGAKAKSPPREFPTADSDIAGLCGSSGAPSAKDFDSLALQYVEASPENRTPFDGMEAATETLIRALDEIGSPAGDATATRPGSAAFRARRLSMRRIPIVYRLARVLNDSANLERIHRAFAAFVDPSDDQAKPDRALDMFAILEALAETDRDALAQPTLANLIDGPISATILKGVYIRASNRRGLAVRPFDESIVRQVADILVIAGKTESANKFLQDVRRVFRQETNKAKIALGAITLVKAAQSVKLAPLEEACLRDADEALKFDPEEWSKNTEGGFTQMAIDTAGIAITGHKEIAVRALDAAEQGINFADDADERANNLRDIARLRVALGDLQKARTLAERAPVAASTMEAYAAILDQLIERRRGGQR
jgi:hypothetical protein